MKEWARTENRFSVELQIYEWCCGISVNSNILCSFCMSAWLDHAPWMSFGAVERGSYTHDQTGPVSRCSFNCEEGTRDKDKGHFCPFENLCWLWHEFFTKLNVSWGPKPRKYNLFMFHSALCHFNGTPWTSTSFGNGFVKIGHWPLEWSECTRVDTRQPAFQFPSGSTGDALFWNLWRKSCLRHDACCLWQLILLPCCAGRT